MKQPVKYPLTPEAKEAAKELVAAWEQGFIQQNLELVDVTAGSGVTKREFIVVFGLGRDSEGKFSLPDLGIIRELAEYELISIRSSAGRIEVTLLQELRNAVENDFEVSDSFLTTSAVGTVVYGNLEVREGAIFQSAVTNQGDIAQNAYQLADNLRQLLGAELLRSAPALEAAIDALQSTDESSRRGKCGKVIAELGRCLEHTANTATILTFLTAIDWASQFARLVG